MTSDTTPTDDRPDNADCWAELRTAVQQLETSMTHLDDAVTSLDDAFATVESSATNSAAEYGRPRPQGIAPQTATDDAAGD